MRWGVFFTAGSQDLYESNVVQELTISVLIAGVVMVWNRFSTKTVLD